MRHRSRKDDPLYRIGKFMLAGNEHVTDTGLERLLLGLRAGDPNDEVLGAWLAKESVRDLYLTVNPAATALLLDEAVLGCLAHEVAEIRSLGETLAQWRTENLAHHRTGASNGPSEGLNPLVKDVKRCGRGFKRFKHCRLPVLFRAGRLDWPHRPAPATLRTPCPHINTYGLITSANGA